MNGLDEILAELCADGREADQETTEEILHRLETGKNYIPTSGPVRREYASLLREEFRRYVTAKNQEKKNPAGE